MKTEIIFSEKFPCTLSQEFYKSVFYETLLCVPELKGKDIIVSVSLTAVSPEEIQKLSKDYRGKDKVTDILSFPEEEGVFTERIHNGKLALGDLIICCDFIRESAKEDKVSLEREFAFIVSHGILHLLGFDHNPEMFAIQDAVTEKFV